MRATPHFSAASLRLAKRRKFARALINVGQRQEGLIQVHSRVSARFNCDRGSVKFPRKIPRIRFTRVSYARPRMYVQETQRFVSFALGSRNFAALITSPMCNSRWFRGPTIARNDPINNNRSEINSRDVSSFFLPDCPRQHKFLFFFRLVYSHLFHLASPRTSLLCLARFPPRSRIHPFPIHPRRGSPLPPATPRDFSSSSSPVPSCYVIGRIVSLCQH